MKNLLLTLALTACSTAPNHLGNPVAWPVHAINSSVVNGLYNARREKVSAFVTDNFAQLKSETTKGGGTAINTAMGIAQVPPEKHIILITELASNPDIYAQDDPEPMIVALMVHGR